MSQKVSGLGSQRLYMFSRNIVGIIATTKMSRGNLEPRATSHGNKEATESNFNALNMFITGAEKFFKAGQIKHFKDAWEKLTSDSWILEWIQGVTIEFTELLY